MIYILQQAGKIYWNLAIIPRLTMSCKIFHDHKWSLGSLLIKNGCLISDDLNHHKKTKVGNGSNKSLRMILQDSKMVQVTKLNTLFSAL